MGVKLGDELLDALHIERLILYSREKGQILVSVKFRTSFTVLFGTCACFVSRLSITALIHVLLVRFIQENEKTHEPYSIVSRERQ